MDKQRSPFDALIGFFSSVRCGLILLGLVGTAVILVEQNVKVAFKLSQRVYVMKAGHIILEETGAKLLERNEWWDLF